MNAPGDDPSGGGGGPPAEEAPKKRKKHHRRHFHEAEADVSINSLLDVLSVILVFLMKGYSASTVQVKPSDDLQVPYTHSQQIVEESTAVTVTLKNILVDDGPVLNFEKGELGAENISSGGMMIDKLYEKLVEEVAFQKKLEAKNPTAKFQGICTVISDRYVPAKMIAQVMYTAGQAGYGTFKFTAIKSER